jgi:hypothetical protein
MNDFKDETTRVTMWHADQSGIPVTDASWFWARKDGMISRLLLGLGKKEGSMASSAPSVRTTTGGIREEPGLKSATAASDMQLADWLTIQSLIVASFILGRIRKNVRFFPLRA